MILNFPASISFEIEGLELSNQRIEVIQGIPRETVYQSLITQVNIRMTPAQETIMMTRFNKPLAEMVSKLVWYDRWRCLWIAIAEIAFRKRIKTLEGKNTSDVDTIRKTKKRVGML